MKNRRSEDFKESKKEPIRKKTKSTEAKISKKVYTHLDLFKIKLAKFSSSPNKKTREKCQVVILDAMEQKNEEKALDNLNQLIEYFGVVNQRSLYRRYVTFFLSSPLKWTITKNNVTFFKLLINQFIKICRAITEIDSNKIENFFNQTIEKLIDMDASIDLFNVCLAFADPYLKQDYSRGINYILNGKKAHILKIEKLKILIARCDSHLLDVSSVMSSLFDCVKQGFIVEHFAWNGSTPLSNRADFLQIIQSLYNHPGFRDKNDFLENKMQVFFDEDVCYLPQELLTFAFEEKAFLSSPPTSQRLRLLANYGEQTYFESEFKKIYDKTSEPEKLLKPLMEDIFNNFYYMLNHFFDHKDIPFSSINKLWQMHEYLFIKKETRGYYSLYKYLSINFKLIHQLTLCLSNTTEIKSATLLLESINRNLLTFQTNILNDKTYVLRMLTVLVDIVIFENEVFYFQFIDEFLKHWSTEMLLEACNIIIKNEGNWQDPPRFFLLRLISQLKIESLSTDIHSSDDEKRVKAFKIFQENIGEFLQTESSFSPEMLRHLDRLNILEPLVNSLLKYYLSSSDTLKTVTIPLLLSKPNYQSQIKMSEKEIQDLLTNLYRQSPEEFQTIISLPYFSVRATYVQFAKEITLPPTALRLHFGAYAADLCKTFFDKKIEIDPHCPPTQQPVVEEVYKHIRAYLLDKSTPIIKKFITEFDFNNIVTSSCPFMFFNNTKILQMSCVSISPFLVISSVINNNLDNWFMTKAEGSGYSYGHIFLSLWLASDDSRIRGSLTSDEFKLNLLNTAYYFFPIYPPFNQLFEQLLLLADNFPYPYLVKFYPIRTAMCFIQKKFDELSYENKVKFIKNIHYTSLLCMPNLLRTHQNEFEEEVRAKCIHFFDAEACNQWSKYLIEIVGDHSFKEQYPTIMAFEQQLKMDEAKQLVSSTVITGFDPRLFSSSSSSSSHSELALPKLTLLKPEAPPEKKA